MEVAERFAYLGYLFWPLNNGSNRTYCSSCEHNEQAYQRLAATESELDDKVATVQRLRGLCSRVRR